MMDLFCLIEANHQRDLSTSNIFKKVLSNPTIEPKRISLKSTKNMSKYPNSNATQMSGSLSSAKMLVKLSPIALGAILLCAAPAQAGGNGNGNKNTTQTQTQLQTQTQPQTQPQTQTQTQPVVAPAAGFLFGFNNITGNSATNALAGENQLLINVTDANGGKTLTSNQVLFTFSNIGSAASSITQIYFDNGTALKSISNVATSATGVSFSQGTGQLPGGNSLSNKFASNFGIQANQPTSQQGVNNTGAGGNEWVSVLFTLDTNKTLQTVIDELQSGALRIGMHIQAFGDGGSEAFVNKPVINTPPVQQPPVQQPPVQQPPVQQPPVQQPPVQQPPVQQPPVQQPPVQQPPVQQPPVQQPPVQQPPVVEQPPVQQPPVQQPPVVEQPPVQQPPVQQPPIQQPPTLTPLVQTPPPPPTKVPEPSTIVALSSLAVGAAMKRRMDKLKR
jgi:hypothetical protein